MLTTRRHTAVSGRLAAACAAVLFGSIASVNAASLTHSLNTTGTANWSAADWGANGVPSNSPGDIATDANAAAASTTLDINAVIGSILNGGTGAWSILSDGTHSLTLDNTGGLANPFGGTNAFIGTTGIGNLTVAPAIVIANTNLTIGDVNSTNTATQGTITLSGSITGTGNVYIADSLGSASAITTALINNSGTLTFGFSDALTAQAGTGAITVGSVGANVSAITDAATGAVTIGAVTLGADLPITSSSNANLVLNGGITGAHNLQLNNNGAGQIQLTTVAVNNAGTITLSGTGSGATIISGGVGTNVGNITISGSGSTSATLGTGGINNNGTITNSGTTTGTTTISGVIGSNITGIIQNSPTSTLVLSGANTFSSGILIKAGAVSGTTSANAFGTGTITLGDTASNSANATLLGGGSLSFANPIVLSNIANATGTLAMGGSGATAATFTGGVTGNNNLTIASSGSGGVTFSTASINNSGTITNAGTGTGTTTINSTIGSNITGITQASSTSPFTITTAFPFSTVTSTGGALFTLTGGFTPTGSLIFNANGAGGITISNAGINNTGTLTNSGTGSGTTTISSAIGANITSVLENGSSPLALTGANSYAGGTTITGGGKVILTTSDGTAGTAANLGIVPSSFSASNIVVDGGAMQAPTVTLNANRGIKIGPNGATMIGTLGNFQALGIISDLSTPGVLTVGAGAGLWVPSAQNTYSGGTIISAGSITVPTVGSTGPAGAPTSGPYGTGPITFAGGQIRGTTGGAVTVANNIIFQADTTVPTALNAQAFTLSGGITLTGTGDRTLTSLSSNVVNLTGVIGESGGSHGFIKAGTGTVALSGAETYTGQTGVTSGILSVSGGSMAGTAVNISSGGTFLVKGNYTIGTSGAGSVSIAGGPTTTGGLLSLLDTTANTLTINNSTTGATALTLGGSAGNAGQLSLDVGSVSDQILLGSGLKASIGAGGVLVNINGLGGFTGTTQTLLSVPGGGLNSGGGFTLGTTTGNFNGYTLALVNTGTTLQLTETLNAPAVAYFKGVIDKNWNTTSGGNTNNSNWTTDSAGTTDAFAVPGATTDVHFYAANATTGNLTTTLGQNFTIKTLTLDGGTLNNAVSIAAGGGTLTLTPTDPSTGLLVNSGSGTLTITAPVALGANQTWTNASTSGISISGGISGSSNLTLQANSTGTISFGTTAVNNTGTVTNAGTGTGAVTISAAIGANVTGVIQNGASQLTLTGTNTAYTGTTTVLNGTLLASSAAATNTYLTLGTGNIVLTGGTLQVRSNGTGSTQTIITGNGTTGNNVTVNGNATLSVDHTSGTNTGSTFQFNNLTLSGGTLSLIGGDSYRASFVGTTTLTANTTLAPTSAPLSLANVTVGDTVATGTTTTLTLDGTATTNTISGVISNNATDSSKVLGLTKSNTGTWTLTGNNTYTGPTLLTGGTLNIGTSTATGSIAGSSSLTISGTSLNIDYSAGVNDRLNNTGTVILNNGGSLTINQGTQATNVTEQVGTLSFGSGSTTLTVSSATGAVTTLAASGLSRTNNSLGLVRGTSLGQTSSNVGEITLTTTPSGANYVGAGGSPTGIGTTKNLSIVPWLIGDITATGTGSNFVTYDTTGGLRALVAAEEDTSLAGATAGDNVRSTAAETGLTANTINALLLAPTATQAITGTAGNTLTISSGAVASTAAFNSTISGFDSVTFGNGEAIISVLASGGTITMNSPIAFASPGGQLTKGGAGTLVLSANSSANYTGTTTINAGTLQVGAGGTTGSISAGTVVDNATLSFNRSDSISFGNTITGTGNLMQNGSGTLTITTPESYTGNTIVAKGTLTISADNTLPAGTTLILGNNLTGGNATQGTFDLTNFNQTVGGLLVQTDGTNAATLKIGASKTLTVTGNVTIGESNTAKTTPKLTATGGGALVVNNTAANSLFQIGASTDTGTTSGNTATVDLSGLSAFSVTLNSTNGNFNIGDNSSGNSGVFSTLLLPTTGAGNTTITAASLTVGTQGRNAVSPNVVNVLKLGSGANVFNVNNFNVGAVAGNTVRDAGSVTFTNSSGTIKLRDATGTGRANLTVGGGETNSLTGIPATDTFDVTGHNADLLINTLTVTDESRNANLTATFSFDTGILDATTISLAKRVNPGLASTLTTTVNFGTNSSSTGAVNVGTGGISILNQQATLAGAVDISTLNILGGTVTLGGDITETLIASAAAHTATLNLNGGTLDMGGHKIGGSAAANNIDAINFQSGTLKNVADINNGGALTKTTNGTLTVAGANTYPGGTSVAGGTLVVSGSISGTSGITVGDGTNPAILSGIGTIATANTGSVSISNAATLAPGASTADLTINAAVSGTSSLSLLTGSTLQLSLANSNVGTGGAPSLSDYSKLTLGAGVSATIGGNIATTLTSSVNTGDLFTIILSGTAVSGVFSNATLVSGTTYFFASGGQAWEINYHYDGSLLGSGNSVASFESITGGTQVALLAVPEPSSIALLAASVGMALGLQRFRRPSR